MNQFFEEHFEGIIALVVGGLIPIIIWFFSYYRKIIVDDFEVILNRATQRIDQEINSIKEKLTILKEKFIQLDEKHHYIFQDFKQDLEAINQELQHLEELKQELQGTRELMLLQNNSLHQQLTDFKEFIKIHLIK